MPPLALSTRRALAAALAALALVVLAGRHFADAGARRRPARPARLTRGRARGRARASSSTSSEPSGGPACTGSRTAAASPTPCAAPEARPGTPTSRSSTSPRRSPTARRWSFRAAPTPQTRTLSAQAGAAARAAKVSLNRATPEELDALPGHRPGNRAEDRRLPAGARRDRLGRRARRRAGNRACAARAASRAGHAVSPPRMPAPHALALALCVGLGARERRARLPPVLGGGRVVAAAALALGLSRHAADAASSRSPSSSAAGGGRACASTRSTAASSPATSARAAWTARRRHRPGSPRRVLAPRCRASSSVSARSLCASPSCSSCRTVARRRRAPASSSPARIERPRPPEDGFDERAWLRRRGVHVVVEGRSLADRRPAWRARRARRPAAPPARRNDRPRARRRTPWNRRRDRARRGGGAVRRAARPLPRLGALPPPGGLGSERRVPRASAVLYLARAVGVGRRLAEVGVLAVIAGYVLAVGWQPSVVRAGVAGCLASLAWLAARPRDRWYFLLARRRGPARVEPVLPPGAGLPALVRGRRRDLRRRRRARSAGCEGYPVPPRLAEVIAVSLACGLATAPIVWLQFGAVPLYTVAGECASRSRSSRRSSASASRVRRSRRSCPASPLALAWVNGWLAAYLAGCARVVGGLPYAQITTWGGLALAAGVPAVVVGARRLRGRERRRLVALAAVALTVGGRLAARPRRASAAAGRPRHVPRRRPGRRRARPDERPGRCSSTRGRPKRDVARQLRRLGVRAACAARPHASAARPRRRRGGGPRASRRRRASSTRGSPAARVRTRTAALREADDVACRSSSRVPVARTGSAACASTCSGRTAPGRPGDDPNLRATVLLVSYRRARPAADSRRRGGGDDPAPPAAGRGAEGRPPRLRRPAAARAARARPPSRRSHLGRPEQRLRAPDARRRCARSPPRPGSTSTAPTATVASPWSRTVSACTSGPSAGADPDA